MQTKTGSIVEPLFVKQFSYAVYARYATHINVLPQRIPHDSEVGPEKMVVIWYIVSYRQDHTGRPIA